MANVYEYERTYYMLHGGERHSETSEVMGYVDRLPTEEELERSIRAWWDAGTAEFHPLVTQVTMIDSESAEMRWTCLVGGGSYVIEATVRSIPVDMHWEDE